MQITIFDLEFECEYFYIHTNSIVEKITFNNRTFYTKLQKLKMPIDAYLFNQYQAQKLSLALPLIENDCVNYIVIEYKQDDWQAFYALLKHLLKSLNIETAQAYRNSNEKLFQLFIPQKKISLESSYKIVEEIKHLLAFKSKKSYKVYPDNNLPKNFNIITLPTQKI